MGRARGGATGLPGHDSGYDDQARPRGWAGGAGGRAAAGGNGVGATRLVACGREYRVYGGADAEHWARADARGARDVAASVYDIRRS